MFDLTVLPFYFTAGRQQPELPGLLAVSAPRRADRRRNGDMMAALFSTSNGQAAPEKFAAEAMQVLSSSYYSSGGTLTSAMREAVEDLNDCLLDRGLKSAELVSGPLLLNLVVIHNDMAYLAHAGPVHTLVLRKDSAQDFCDAQGAGRGLGLSRTVSLRYFNSMLEAGDLLLLCANAPASWNPQALANSPQLSLEGLRRRLLNQAPGDIRAGVLQVSAGSGQTRVGQFPGASSTRAAETVAPVPAPKGAVTPAPTPVPTPPSQAQPQIPAEPVKSAPAQEPQPMPLAAPMPEPAQTLPTATEIPALEDFDSEPAPAPVSSARQRLAERRARQSGAVRKPGLFARLFNRQKTETIIESGSLEGDTPISEPAPARKHAWTKPLAIFFRRTRRARSKAGESVGGFLPRLLPGAKSQSMSLSPGTMLFIAIAVPAVIVAIATTVYIRKGASEKRVADLEQASAYMQIAVTQKDPSIKRDAWMKTVYWIKQAESFGVDNDSTQMRRQAQTVLDNLDGIVRMSLAPAYSGILASTVNITHMVASGNDLYLLDGASGRVMHMILAGRGYEYDPNFSCGPGPAEGLIIGPLVGVAPLPMNNQFDAAVIAVDATGNLLYCINGSAPKSAPLAPPANNWGKISNMDVYNGNLYVMDKQYNAVWRYDGADYEYTYQPRLFFGNEVPDLSDVVDMAVYQDDLYMLRSSGKMTVCNYSGFDFSPTRCSDTNTYVMPGGTVDSVSGTQFVQLQTTLPPDPSLFVLDSKSSSVYHFSLRLNYQRQLRQEPDSEFPLPAKAVTAFTVAPNRVLFLAFGNQIYFGALP